MTRESTLHPNVPAPAVRVREVGRAFARGALAIDRIDLEVARGEFVAILGPSGCGKSTLLRLIAGLDRPTRGAVSVDTGGSRNDGIAVVFQDAHLLPWRTVAANVELPLELAGVAHRHRRDQARDALARVGLGDALDLRPAQLSGGMRMRVSLARALVTEPALLLLDEPFAALDEITRQRLDEDLHGLWRAAGTTVLFVTHSIAEAAFLAQRVVVLSPRPATVVEDVVVDITAPRTADLRTSPEFNAVVRRLQRLLREAA